MRRGAQAGVAFQDTFETCYDLVDKRLPNRGEQRAGLKRRRIPIGGVKHQGAPNELRQQVFTQTVIGPILFESIELDPVRRSVLQDPALAQ